MSLTGSSAGDFFHRAGLLHATVRDVTSIMGGATSTNVASAAQVVPTRLASVTTDVVASGTKDYIVSALVQQAFTAFQSAGAGFFGQVQSLSQTLLIDMCNVDLAGSVNAGDSVGALRYLIDKMVTAAAFIDQGTLPAVGAQTAAGWVTPTGNPVWIWSVKDAAGRALQYVYPETITVGVTADAQNGATAGQEPWTMSGLAANPAGILDPLWLTSTYGSGASLTGQLIDPTISNTGGSTGNLTVNGGFTTFTNTNYPDNWKFVTGVATTNFLNSSATKAYYAGTGTPGAGAPGSLELLSAGGTKNEVYQQFGTTLTTGAGTGGSPYPFVASAVNNTQYVLFFAYQLKTASPTNGTLTVRLCDSAGTTIADDAGTNNTLAIDLTAIADTAWHTGSLVIRLPKVLTTNLPMSISFAFTGTILDATNAVYLGGVGLSIAAQFYPGGPFVVGFRGSTNPNASGTYPDAWTFAVTATIGKLQ